jgi:hypothetical protein
LEPVAGETEHVPRPQPVLLSQPPVIVQGVADASAPVPEEVDAPGERTERIDLAPPKEPRSWLPYLVAGGLVVSGVVLGFLALEGDRLVLPFWQRQKIQQPSVERTEGGKAASGGNTQQTVAPPTAPPDAGAAAEMAKDQPLEAPTVGAQGEGGAVKPPPLLSMTSEAAKIDTLLIQARAAYKRSAFRKANVILEEVLSRKPGHAEAIALQALVSLGEGKTAKGAELARKALAIDESSADAHLVLGTVDLESDRTPKAREHFMRYLQLVPRGDHAEDVRAVLKRIQ